MSGSFLGGFAGLAARKSRSDGDGGRGAVNDVLWARVNHCLL